MVFVCIFGIAAAYLVFIASTLATIVPYTQNDLIMAITPAMVALSWLRSLAGVSIIRCVPHDHPFYLGPPHRIAAGYTALACIMRAAIMRGQLYRFSSTHPLIVNRTPPATIPPASSHHQE
eukprot:1188768-Prorocentrum_minimum.AAC.1